MKKLLVIASYPPKGETHHKAIVGGASYTKNTLLALKKASPETEITVLAEVLPSSPNRYEDNGIQVKRVWKRNSLWSFWNLLKTLQKEKATNILFSFEFAMFGGILSLLPLPFFLLLCRLQKINISIVLHQVIIDAASMSGHMNIPSHGIIPWLYTLLFRFFYATIVTLTTQTIVFDEALKKRLAAVGKTQKITVIPHGVESFSSQLSKREAREQLKITPTETVLLCFGFLAWYKGTDWIVDAYSRLPEEKRKNITLVLAGGPNPNHLDKPFYRTYIESLQKLCETYQIRLTGFVDEKDIPLYFTACDIALFPYRSFMAASGPISLAFSLGTPIMVSSTLSPIFTTRDIQESLEELSLHPSDLIFSLSEDSFETIKKTAEDKNLLDKLHQLSIRMQQKRSWDTIGNLYKEALI